MTNPRRAIGRGSGHCIDHELSTEKHPNPQVLTATKPAPTPRYEAGWMLAYGSSEDLQPTAFLRPYDEDWYDLYEFKNWWDALAKAMSLASEVPDCRYIGGPQ